MTQVDLENDMHEYRIAEWSSDVWVVRRKQEVELAASIALVSEWAKDTLKKDDEGAAKVSVNSQKYVELGRVINLVSGFQELVSVIDHRLQTDHRSAF